MLNLTIYVPLLFSFKALERGTRRNNAQDDAVTNLIMKEDKESLTIFAESPLLFQTDFTNWYVIHAKLVPHLHLIYSILSLFIKAKKEHPIESVE